MSTACVKIYCCLCCKYTSKRKYDLHRHHLAKHRGVALQESLNDENAASESENGGSSNFKDVIENTNDALCASIVKENEFMCKKCNKCYKSNRYLKKHEENCKRIDVLTCPRCMASFADRSSKSHHIKRNTCKPRSIMYARTPNVHNIEPQCKQINKNKKIVNYTNSTINKNKTYNTQNIKTQNNNIYINNFGSERIDYLSNDELRKILMSCENMIPMYIERKHFDKDFPENRNITYTKDNKCLVKEKEIWNERNLNSISTKLINENSKKLLLFYDNNIIEIGNHVADDDIMIRVKDRLVSLYTKSDVAKYKQVLDLIKEVIKKSKECSQE